MKNSNNSQFFEGTIPQIIYKKGNSLQNVLVKSKYSSYISLRSQNTEGNNQSLKTQFKTTKCTSE